MTDAVTYADLRFTDIPMKEMKLSDDLGEMDAEDGDVMYENVTGTAPPTPREEAAVPAPAQEKGFWTWLSLLPLLLTLSLVLIASNIGLAVKYFDLSNQCVHLSGSHMEEIVSLTQRLQRKEEDVAVTENILERSRQENEELVGHFNTSLLECQQAAKESLDERERLSLGNEILNTSLLECQKTAKTSSDEKENVEERLKEIMSQIQEQKTGSCPEDWKLFGNKCLFFSKQRREWHESKADCENKGSNLMVVQWADAILQNRHFTNLLADARGDFWVGKELKGTEGKTEWKWPAGYDKSSYDDCWALREGKITRTVCWSRNGWICEKNLVLTSLKSSGRLSRYFSFSLWDKQYKCTIQ